MSAIKVAVLSGLAAVASASGAVQGFNYASTSVSNAPLMQNDFQSQFTQAKNLVGTDNGFTSARLYTMIQAGTLNTPISAIPAAIATNTRLLLGMWASGGQDGFNAELAALKSAISTYGAQVTPLIDGLSVGSEDLYRITPTGISNNAGVGAGPDVVSNFIAQARQALAGTAWSSIPVGHVDTWTAWVNSSNDQVIQNSDFLGLDTYPYFQPQDPNTPQNDPGLFNDALQKTIGVAGGKPVWVTETGYPVSGPTSGQSVASTQNAQLYWDQVACPLLGSRNTWWYTLSDAPASPSFGVTTQGSTTPLYDLSCKNVMTNSSTTSSSSTPAGPSSTPVKAQSSGSVTVISASSSSYPQSSSAVAAMSSSAKGSSSPMASGSAKGSSSPMASAPAPAGASVAPASGPAQTSPASGAAQASPVSGGSAATTPSSVVNSGASRVGVSMGALAIVGAIAMLF